ncbi:sugar O-acetyltransferase [Parabacteroides sp. PF5-6]|uniref:sugar O-acetyltransferase n=1 Tax=Parabacteroides sp. PF5-6 TaxID=1742403 RepID=UPI0024052348|nr:sugar O-acetyltransferase [Parabacteroides sp. PF5-6]MDF9830210.1 maltose O-acetyltransferase [Parabacteroides sp. PF5-6]
MKTEKQKMLAGESYNPTDKELLNRWHLAKKIMKEFNHADTQDERKLNNLLEMLLGSKGKNLWISAPFFVDYGENIHIGDNCEINMNCVFLDCNKITIGDNCGIGPNVQIYAVSHPVDPRERLNKEINAPMGAWKIHSAPVTLGNNVWIGGGSIILQGVTIGDNTTIGAGSVVTQSIPANCLAAGNPCRVIKELC